MQVNNLREAMADKDLLIMELREEKAQLQVRVPVPLLLHAVSRNSRPQPGWRLQFDSSQAQGSWQAALQHKDHAIQQLNEALQSKEQALVTLSQRDAAWQRSPSQTAHGQQAHDHDMEQLRLQLAEHNATITALRTRLTGDSQPLHSSDTPGAPPRLLSHASAAHATQPDSSAPPHSSGQRTTADRHQEVDLARASNLSFTAQTATGSRAPPGVDLARRGAQHSTAEQSGTPRSRRSDTENAANAWPARPPLRPVSGAGLQEEATFLPAHAPPTAHSTPRAPPHGDAVSTLRHELLTNVRRAQEVVGQLPHDSRRGEARLQGLLREQEALLQGMSEEAVDDGFGERFRSVLEERLREASTRTHILSMEVRRPCAAHGRQAAGCARPMCTYGKYWCVVSASTFPGSVRDRNSRGVKCRCTCGGRLVTAGMRDLAAVWSGCMWPQVVCGVVRGGVRLQNEDLEARLAAAQDSCGELRAVLQERDSSALEQQLEADALRARLADVANTRGSPRKARPHTLRSPQPLPSRAAMRSLHAHAAWLSPVNDPERIHVYGASEGREGMLLHVMWGGMVCRGWRRATRRSSCGGCRSGWWAATRRRRSTRTAAAA